MGKRSDFERIERDYYSTPMDAVIPLLPHLKDAVYFAEPCAGDGALVKHLEDAGMICVFASDIEPKADSIFKLDALRMCLKHIIFADAIITNPPWRREILHPMIEHFRKLAPTWLLIDADWKHTKQSAPFMRYCAKVVSVGRVRWFPESKMTGKDNCAWYLFGMAPCETRFYGRVFDEAANLTSANHIV